MADQQDAVRSICTCEIPDPVMQAGMRFQCFTCGLPRPAQLCDRCQRIVTLELRPVHTALIARLRKEIASIERLERGSTHWDGCDAKHGRCRTLKLLREAADALDAHRTP